MGEDEEIERAIRRDPTRPVLMAVVIVLSIAAIGLGLRAVARMGIGERASRGYFDTFDAPPAR